ncbi:MULTISPECIES: glycoside hydrolase family 88 protein [unclassified Sphingobacterium]|uniref:glycoside hydrolase family 88 protein n=1 Tax=unclassified Sphingobacterium TaxID=2609468 RepID=UPI002953DA86|nr:glycoside hydrolase family 88 protein [Sphingobacterium sp. UGAL515B_05]WON96478.1 glycoside hydrolase family 88 protein [Sphingobacterium sp. UGAL515B_05]
MRKLFLILINLVVFVPFSGFGQQKPFSEQMANTVLEQLYPDSLFNRTDKFPKWSYDMGVIFEGLTDVWRNTANATYFNYMQSRMDAYLSIPDSIKNYDAYDFNIDNIKNGTALLTLYKVTGKEKYLKACHQLYAQLQKQPRTHEGGFWHKKIYPYQMWLDGLYMGQPFYAEYASLMDIPAAFDDIANQFSYMEKNARDKKTGLLYHGWDESRKERWSNPKTGLSPHFWARGMGWYVMALVDVLDYFPEEHPRRPELLAILNRTLSAIVTYQDVKTGVWYDIVDLGTRKGNYLESSASSMFVFALAKSLRKGYIPVSFQKNLDRGYQGLVKEFIVPAGENRVNLTKTVQVSGLGGKNYRDGSFAYYMSEPVVTNDPKGVGAFILAASEVEFAKEQKGKKRRTVTLDNYFNNEYKKTASGQLKPYHYLWDGDDNNGFSLLGRVFEKNGGQLNTLKTAPTLQNLSKSNIYIIVDPDTEKETEHPHFMNETDAQQISQWVKQGGVLVLFLNDSGNCEINKFNTLAQKFGITFNEDSRNRVKGNDFQTGAIAIPKGNAIFPNATQIYIKEISTLQAKAPAQALIQDHGDTIIATAKYGKGTVFAIGDPWLYNEYTDGRKLPKEYENFTAANDLVHWLFKQINN